MGHLGLTPQSVHAMGGYRVQGRTEHDAQRLMLEAEHMAKAGAFAIVLEGVPIEVARDITGTIDVPTIGIGAGPHCDGQVLVLTDMLGLGAGPYPRFVKPYADLRSEVARAVTAFKNDVASGTFPDHLHSYG
jgi:3-methyl-2-oxobutanoate hydroxymethyltransferase